ncbi:monofunctional biosynthetic peptidoglycan transglycosylase [Hyphomicrobium album]|nr:monofunctional biosynthetic peptidoglycan transglycosylase [Hyphomicrobium album]
MERSDSPRPPAADPAAEKAEQPKRAATGEPASGDEPLAVDTAAPRAADPFVEAEPEATERGHFETIERETTQPVRRYFEPRNSAPPVKRAGIAEAVSYTPPHADDERPAYLDALSEAMRAHEMPEPMEDEQLAEPAFEPWPDPLSTTQPGARAQQRAEPVAAPEPEAATEPPRAADPDPAAEPPQDPPAPPAPSFEPSPFQVMRPLPARGPLSALADAARARQAAAPEAKQEAPAETAACEPDVVEPVPPQREVAPEPPVQEAAAPPAPPSSPEIARDAPPAPAEPPPMAPPPPAPPKSIAAAPPPVRQDYSSPRPSPPSQFAPPFTRAEPAMRPTEPAMRPKDPAPRRPVPPPPSPAPRAPTLQHDVAAAWAPPQRREPSFYRDAPQQPAAEATAVAAPESRDWRDLIRRAANVAFLVFVGWFVAVLLLIGVYRFVNPPFSMLMMQQALTGTPIDKQWVPIERISPNLSRAVIVAEDGRFCEHWGIDFIEMAHAVRRASDGYPRGASTITMQVAKNLFLVPTKSYLRKIVEVPLTFAIELAWPKWRILEIYLNIVEWGPGVFGAEAASRAHFGRPASSLSARQAAQLAVVLPNPIVRDAGSPGPRTSRRASTIQARAAGNRTASSCVDGRR